MSDSEWLRRMKGSWGLSKPASFVGHEQWAPISVFLIVLGQGSCMKPGWPNSRDVRRSEIAAFQSASHAPTDPSSLSWSHAMHGGHGIWRLPTRGRQSIEMPSHFSAAMICRETT